MERGGRRDIVIVDVRKVRDDGMRDMDRMRREGCEGELGVEVNAGVTVMSVVGRGSSEAKGGRITQIRIIYTYEQMKRTCIRQGVKQ